MSNEMKCPGLNYWVITSNSLATLVQQALMRARLLTVARNKQQHTTSLGSHLNGEQNLLASKELVRYQVLPGEETAP